METGSAQAQAQPAVPPMQTASVQSQALPPIQSASRAQGGTQITVSSNDSLTMISQRYGVPASAILAANGMQNANQISPGTRLTIPAHGSAAPVQVAAAAPVRPVAAPAPPPAPAAQPKFRLVDASKNKAPVEAADASKRTRPGMAKPDAVKVAAVSSGPLVSAPTPVVPQKVASLPEAKAVKAAPVAPAVEAAPSATKQVASKPADPEQTASVSNDSAAGDFRWPARGRVIAGFGANGGNEGINIAVPEGHARQGGRGRHGRPMRAAR